MRADPVIGDYVGKRATDGVDLYIVAVDTERRLVRIGELGRGHSDWLDETQARAFYNYEWGALKPIPWLVRALAEATERR